MALKVSVKHPDYPDDQVFHVNGLGSFQNGKSTALTKEQEEAYFNTTGTTVKEGLKDSPTFSVEGTAEFKKGGD